MGGSLLSKPKRPWASPVAHQGQQAALKQEGMLRELRNGRASPEIALVPRDEQLASQVDANAGPVGGEAGAGAPLEEGAKTLMMRVGGMACAACAASIEKGLKRLEGVISASVSVMSNTARVEYNPAVIQVRIISKRTNTFQ